MRVLVVGSGGREHALCWAISASPLVSKLYCAPGNTGIAKEAECIDISAENVAGLVQFAKEKAIEFVVIGPEVALVSGLVDQLEDLGIKAFGPTRNASILEGSKGFMKDFCRRHKIPSAAYGRFTEINPAKAFIDKNRIPIVIKADGLAAGKGVIIAETVEQAYKAVEDMMDGEVFGKAGSEVVIEEFLTGEEVSFFALCDGKNALPLVSAQDHKKVGDGDTGPNTGGMGAYSPALIATPDMVETIMDTIIKPTLSGMNKEKKPYKGILYAGLMVHQGVPKLLEYNVRFGDPECQVLMMCLKSDLLPALIAACDGVLNTFDLRWYEEPALVVVMASKGYPGTYIKGTVIKGLKDLEELHDVKVFHAGTSAGPKEEILATGGRVLGITAIGKNISSAQFAAYQAIDVIDWPNGFCRRDIGWRAIQKKQ